MPPSKVRTKGQKRDRASAASVQLISVYRVPKVAPELLYRLLEQREPHVNISHQRMPSWQEHVRFIASRPYVAWYLIKHGPNYVGAIYLTGLGEIGIGVLAEWRGHGLGPAAVQAIMSKHPRSRFLANINPLNVNSIQMFAKMGFRIIQQTYELRRK